MRIVFVTDVSNTEVRAIDGISCMRVDAERIPPGISLKPREGILFLTLPRPHQEICTGVIILTQSGWARAQYRYLERDEEWSDNNRK